jgi:hypothetical protein
LLVVVVVDRKLAVAVAVAVCLPLPKQYQQALILLLLAEVAMVLHLVVVPKLVDQMVVTQQHLVKLQLVEVVVDLIKVVLST